MSGPGTAPREEKLPRWAQLELAKARRRAEDAEQALADHQASLTPTRIWYGDFNNPIYVPVTYGHERVHFDLGEHGEHYTEIQVCLDRQGRLEIQGGHAVCLDLQSSNTFQVRFAE